MSIRRSSTSGSCCPPVGLLLLFLLPAFSACSDGDDPDVSQDLTIQWYDPETKAVKKSEGLEQYGRKEGQWSYFYENGRLERQGTFAAGLKTGVWTGWHPDGSVKVRGSFAGDQSDGLWEEFYPNGVVAKRTSWSNGTIIGKVQQFHSDGDIMTVTPFVNGVPHGLELVYHPGGEVGWTKTMVEGKPEGESIGRFPGGALQFIGTFKAGKTAGEWHYWYAGGEYQTRRTYDELGNSLGTWLTYGPQGQAITSHEHREDGAIFAQEWTPGGKRRSYGPVNSGGLPVGPFFVWKPDGSLDPDLSGMHDGKSRTGSLSPESIALAQQLAAEPGTPAPRPGDSPKREDHDPGQ